MSVNHLLVFGYGYSARYLAKLLDPQDWRVTGTTRDGRDGLRWPGEDVVPALKAATHILSSVPPGKEGDPVLDVLRAHAGDLPNLQWLGLLSTTGVYGGANGEWVDETAPHVPNGHRGALRARQYDDWMALHQDHGLPVHVFHLAGIYGPGRSAFDKLRDGTARRIVKPGQVFSRIHVEDIAQIVAASIARPDPGTAYNVADDLPAPPQDVIEEAANLLGVPVPPDIPFETADLSPMARSFYADNKRVSNARIKEQLGVKLLYPDYHAGLRAILNAEA
ncbi:SDR family oxidoreductase [Halovulum sp. GXIMD14793]